MAKQKSLKQAHEQGYLELSYWADLMLRRIRMNYQVQRIWPLGASAGGPYKDYHIVVANRKRKGQATSTGESIDEKNLRKQVYEGAGGNTVAVDFFFRYYLFFVDWGVGRGQKIPQVPRKANLEKGAMKKRYANWRYTGDRQRRPVVLGAIRGSRFFLGNILQDYWGKEAEFAVLYGLGYQDDKGEYVEFSGV